LAKCYVRKRLVAPGTFMYRMLSSIFIFK